MAQAPKQSKETVQPTQPPYQRHDTQADQTDAMRAAMKSMDLNAAAQGAITAAHPIIDKTIRNRK
jgi:hypothetical protein